MAEDKYNKAYIEAKKQQAEKYKEVSHKESKGRLPPGQVLTKTFPILDLGIRPTLDRYSKWTLEIKGNVENPIILSVDEVKKMADTDITADFHCVTRWSRFDLHWSGIPFSKIMEITRPPASVKFVIFHSFDKYTTNATMEDVMQKNVILATKLDANEIPPEHGGPIRMILPHLYGWKSAKFLTEIEFVDEDRPGFWEVRGYSNRARPWIEERYSGD
ncbi:MAG: sulfite oxidase-like oxidoreductase [Parcubacteria group bacterium]|nr:sulfite oxidase-like oxidoreductase [Parcubacteria group bacterium]